MPNILPRQRFLCKKFELGAVLMKVYESVCIRNNNPGTKTNILCVYMATYFTPSLQ